MTDATKRCFQLIEVLDKKMKGLNLQRPCAEGKQYESFAEF